MSTSGDCTRVKQEEDKNIDEVLALLMKREPEVETFFACWTCKELVHYSSSCPKRERKTKLRKPYKSRIPKDWLFVNEHDELDLKMVNFVDSDDEEDDKIGFVVVKEESLEK